RTTESGPGLAAPVRADGRQDDLGSTLLPTTLVVRAPQRSRRWPESPAVPISSKLCAGRRGHGVIDEVEQVAPPAQAPPVGRRDGLLDAAAVVALLALFPVVHDVPSLLHAPYFLDEAWVALSVRFPLSQLPLLTSSTPIGWSFLLRLVPDT